LRLFRQDALFAASRIFCTAGKSRPIKTAMMAMTTSSSTSVNPARRPGAEEEERLMLELRAQSLQVNSFDTLS